jgi:hypothetical protein
MARCRLDVRWRFEQTTYLWTRAGQKFAFYVRNVDEIGAEQSIELPLAEVDGPSDQEQGKDQPEYADQYCSQGVSPSSSNASKSNGI